jgi:hypothetical protein
MIGCNRNIVSSMSNEQAALIASAIYCGSGAVPHSAEQVEARASEHLVWLKRMDSK